MTAQNPRADRHDPPNVSILRLNADDSAAWSHVPAFQAALISLARRLTPFVIKSADRKILYRIDAPPLDRTHFSMPDFPAPQQEELPDALQ